MNDCFFYFYTTIGGYSPLVQKVRAQKKYGVKRTFSGCLKDKRPKRWLGVADNCRI